MRASRNTPAQYPHCSRAYGAWALDFLKAAKASGKPFCMSISFKAPHLPFTPDPIDLKLYDGEDLHATVRTMASRTAGTSHRRSTPAARPLAIANGSTIMTRPCAIYYALITGVDAAVGMIREGLEREGLADSTVIIFTSDNGYNCRLARLRRQGHSV